MLCTKRSICYSANNKPSGVAACIAVTKKIIHASVCIRPVDVYRRSCMVFNSFFLVYAAHVVILGLAWRMWAQPSASHDQSTETAAINTAIRVLDFCGQRNTFARKYSLLIKELRSQLDRGPSSAGRISMTTTYSSASSASPYASSQMIGLQSAPSLGSISYDESLGQVGSSSHAYTLPDNLCGQESGANQPLASVELRQRSLSTDFDGMSFDPWLEQSQALGLVGDSLFPGTSL